MEKPRDFKKKSAEEGLTAFQFKDHVRHVQDTAATLNPTKEIDKYAVRNAMQGYNEATEHIRLLNLFVRTYAGIIPSADLKAILYSGRRVTENSRSLWVHTHTKMKSGITAANQLAKYNLPGLSSEERKILNKVNKTSAVAAEKVPKYTGGRGFYRGGRGGRGAGRRPYNNNYEEPQRFAPKGHGDGGRGGYRGRGGYQGRGRGDGAYGAQGIVSRDYKANSKLPCFFCFQYGHHQMDPTCPRYGLGGLPLPKAMEALFPDWPYEKED